MVTEQTMVGMAEIQVIDSKGQLVCLGLGSCIGVCIVDPQANVAGMAHIMLPATFPNSVNDKPGKFADSALPTLISLLEKKGAQKSRMKVAYAGGAQVFKFGENSSKLDVGLRNSQAVAEWLQSSGLKIISSDVGGTVGRTVTYSMDSGDFKVRTVQKGESTLCNLKGS